MPSNPLYSIILYLEKKKKLSISTYFTMKMTSSSSLYFPKKSGHGEKLLLLYNQAICFRQALFLHTSEIKMMNLNDRRMIGG